MKKDFNMDDVLHKFVATVGGVTLDHIRKYVENQ